MKRLLVLGDASVFPLEFTLSSEFIFIKHSESTQNWTVNETNIPTLHTQDEALSSYGWVVGRLAEAYPLYSRHYDNQPRFEETLRRHSWQTLELAQFILDNEVGAVLLTTSSSHHLDSLCLELAAEIAGVPQIFLYCTVFQNRLLPIIQTRGFDTRVPLGLRTSSLRIEQVLNQTPAETIGRAWPTKNSRIESFALAVIRLCWIFPFSKMKELYFANGRSSNISREVLRRWSFGVQLRMYRIQKRAIKLLRHLEEDDLPRVKNFLHSTTDKPLVFFAHFQPESTSYPEGGKNFNHIDNIVLLRQLGFNNPILFKEHPNMYFYEHFWPSQAGMARSEWFYSTLKKLGVLYVSPSLTLPEDYIAVTITGTRAIERSLEGKPTIVLGQPWFQGLPGTYSPEEWLRLKFEKNLNGGPASSGSISSQAVRFLDRIWSEKTLSNYLGVGTGQRWTPSQDEEDEFRAFLNQILDLACTHFQRG